MSTKDYESPDIVIKVRGKNKPGDPSTKKRRSPLPPSRPNEGIFRRRRRSSGRFLNLYDFGQITDGAGGWTTPVYNIPTLENGGTEAAINAIRNEPLGHAVSTWKTRYRRVIGAAAEHYNQFVEINFGDRVAMLASNSGFTSSGLALTDPVSTLQVLGYPAATPAAARFYHFGVIDTESAILDAALIDVNGLFSGGGFKTTTSPSFAAAEATPFPAFTGDIDVFAPPLLMRVTRDGIQGPNYYVLSRSAFANTTLFPTVTGPDVETILDTLADFIAGPGSATTTQVLSTDYNSQLVCVIVHAAQAYYIWRTF